MVHTQKKCAKKCECDEQGEEKKTTNRYNAISYDKTFRRHEM